MEGTWTSGIVLDVTTFLTSSIPSLPFHEFVRAVTASPRFFVERTLHRLVPNATINVTIGMIKICIRPWVVLFLKIRSTRLTTQRMVRLYRALFVPSELNLWRLMDLSVLLSKYALRILVKVGFDVSDFRQLGWFGSLAIVHVRDLSTRHCFLWLSKIIAFWSGRLTLLGIIETFAALWSDCQEISIFCHTSTVINSFVNSFKIGGKFWIKSL